MCASKTMLYALAISAWATFSACGEPPATTDDGGGNSNTLCTGKQDGPSCPKPDGGTTVPAPTGLAVVGSPGVDSVTLGCSVTGVDAVEVNYWNDDNGYYGRLKKVFTATPYTLTDLRPDLTGRKYYAFAVAIKGTEYSAPSETIEFTTAKMPDACAGFVVPLATRCSSDGLPPYGDPEVWTLKPGPEHCYLQGQAVDFVMTSEMSGATRFTATSTAGQTGTCVQ